MEIVNLTASVLGIIAAIISIISALSARKYKNEVMVFKNEITGINAIQETSGIGNRSSQSINSRERN